MKNTGPSSTNFSFSLLLIVINFLFSLAHSRFLEESPEKILQMRLAIKNWSPEEKKQNQVYAVKSGASVRASSYRNSFCVHYQLDYTLNTPNSWCPKKAQLGEYIQVSMDNPVMWTGVQIQGRGDFSQWVTSFKVASTMKGKIWKDVEDGQIYSGVSGRTQKKRYQFRNPVYARVIRIYPLTWEDYPSMRFDATYIQFPGK